MRPATVTDRPYRLGSSIRLGFNLGRISKSAPKAVVAWLRRNVGTLISGFDQTWESLGLTQPTSGAMVGTTEYKATTQTSLTGGAAAVVEGGKDALTWAGTGGDVNTTTEEITLGAGHGLTSGDAVLYNDGASGISGLTNGTVYYVSVSTNVIKLYETNAEALADGGAGSGLLDLDSVGGDDNTLSVSGVPNDSGDSIVMIDHGLETGDRIFYSDGSGAGIGGLSDGTTYFAIVVDDNTIQLATTPVNAVAGTEIVIDVSSSDDDNELLPTGAVTVEDDTITTTGHGFSAGDAVIVDGTLSGSTVIGGLSTGTTYYVGNIDGDDFSLYDNETNAEAGGSTGKVDLTSGGIGENLLLQPLLEPDSSGDWYRTKLGVETGIFLQGMLNHHFYFTGSSDDKNTGSLGSGPASVFNNDQWYYFTVMRDGSSASMYLNGEYVSTIHGLEDSAAPDGPGVGGVTVEGALVGAASHSSWDIDACLNGKIDQPSVWSRCLEASEILALYNSGDGLEYSDFSAGLLSGLFRCLEFDGVISINGNGSSASQLHSNVFADKVSGSNVGAYTCGKGGVEARTIVGGKVSDYAFTPSWNDVLVDGVGVTNAAAKASLVLTGSGLYGDGISRCAIDLEADSVLHGRNSSNASGPSRWTVSAWLQKHGESSSRSTYRKLTGNLGKTYGNSSVILADYKGYSGFDLDDSNFFMTAQGNMNSDFLLWNLS